MRQLDAQIKEASKSGVLGGSEMCVRFPGNTLCLFISTTRLSAFQSLFFSQSLVITIEKKRQMQVTSY